ncbi:MAG: hypothetical protein ACYCO0_01325 [Candidatus Micrarchaeaceae archaeon]
MVIIKGYLEILQMANGNAPKSFNDFTTISINGKRLSSATVSKRLDQLISVDALKEVINRSHTGRRIIAYRTTERGRKVIELAEELKVMLTVSAGKRQTH